MKYLVDITHIDHAVVNPDFGSLVLRNPSPESREGNCVQNQVMTGIDMLILMPGDFLP